MKFRILIITVLITLSTQAQDYGLQLNTRDAAQSCQLFNQAFSNRSKESKFGIKREGNKLFLQLTDEKWFKKLLQTSEDGIAIDIVSKDQYDCDATLPNSQVRGTLLKPVFKKNLLRTLKPTGNNRFKTQVGLVPAALQDKKLEFNILFLSKKNLCQYYNVYNLETYPWDLLDMGLFFDKVTYGNENITTTDEIVDKKLKNLTFIIPFEKNKSVYTPADIKPLYDSLRLTDFNIKSININAYASVEGSTARNNELQSERGSTIAAALKSYATSDVAIKVQTAENWAEFFTDIKGTPHASMSSLSQDAIKAQLKGAKLAQLEPILSNHRKAVVRLGLQRIDRYNKMSDKQLFKEAIDKAIAGDMENARALQMALYSRLINNAHAQNIDDFPLPAQITDADMRNNFNAFGYFQDKRRALIAKQALQKIEASDPKNKKVKYNITAIDIYLYRANAIDKSLKELQQQVRALRNVNISKKLVDRMLVNLEIITAEKANRKRDYKAKDKSVMNIKRYYRKLNYSNKDYLSMAQFLSYYANTDAASAFLQPVVNKIDVDEDLLYYYINLTLVNPELISQDSYRQILLNAYSQNSKRFCELFNASTDGGVTFQLLTNEYLRKQYCESCKS